MKIISVFGSAAPQPGSVDYELARQMGRLLAEAGFAAQTGGYGGVMAAVSRGAAEAGGHVLGITCAQIETFRPVSPNRWLAEEIKYQTLRRRLTHLTEKCDGIVVMPGGVGTLTELALSWNMILVGEIPPRPLIAVGGLWAGTLNAFIDPAYVTPQFAALVQSAQTPREAIRLLMKAVA